MVSPDKEQLHPSTIEIKSGDTRATVNPLGATVERFQVGVHNVIHPPKTFRVGEKAKDRGAIPLLFPIAGPPPKDHPPLRLKQHGFARDLTWTVIDRGSESVTLQLAADEETRKQYPYDFAFQNRISLKNGVLRYNWSIANNSSEPMPTAPGIHPYFLITRDQIGSLNTNLPDLPRPDDWPQSYITDLPEDGIRAEAPGWGKVRVEGSRHFKKAVVWSDWLGDYACLELFRGGKYAITDEQQALIIRPGETVNPWVEIEFTPES